MAPIPSLEDVVYKPDGWSSLGPQNNPVDTEPVNGVLPTGIIVIIVVAVVGGIIVFATMISCLISQSKEDKRGKRSALGRTQDRHHHHKTKSGAGRRSVNIPRAEDVELRALEEDSDGKPVGETQTSTATRSTTTTTTTTTVAEEKGRSPSDPSPSSIPAISIEDTTANNTNNTSGSEPHDKEVGSVA